MTPNTDDLQMPPSWRAWWGRVWQPRPRNSVAPPPRHLRLPQNPLPPASDKPTWAAITQRVRQWPSGMPVTVDLLVAIWHVGRGTAWHWLDRLTQAGLLRVTVDTPDAHGVVRRHWWVR
ncbi:hypothetical protein [Sulfobacillus sp. hq2]|uniref:hypothetical protein n=1 Tax=Sulfobacillus TaxID=28033 RepID=UPI000CD088AB|nr:hypothetical protein [Sulfobacillus sp. hq2]POB09666.1 hypothetical protein CO251_15800 [Sulfobacillus sp. hq2]